jgi:iron complex outermembrane receptor protein
MRAWAGVLLGAGCLLFAAAGRAEGPSELDLFALDSQLEAQVVSSTKTQTRGAQAPAVVTVISAEELQARGYSSLADVLRVVPGFYDVFDLTTHNVGVRGINGGLYAAGNVIKVMIDGHPVDYRPTTGNFFGEELIPLGAIERIEIIRGPASALYGANAFLGVVNIITRSGESTGFRLVGQGALVREHPGGGGGALAGGAGGNVDVLVAANYLFLNRSGLGLPAESPIGGAARSNIEGRGRTQVDYMRPASIFGKLTLHNVLGGRLTALASIQSLDAHGPYQPFGPIVHETRVAWLNQNYRVLYEVTPVKRFTLTLSGHYFNAYPTAKERLDVGRSDYYFLRSGGADGFGVSAEGRIQAHPAVSLTVGTDYVRENHLLQTFNQRLTEPVLAQDGVTELRKRGTIIPGENEGARRLFHNVGVYLQGLASLKTDWSLAAGLRMDWHSIYGVNFGARGGVVYAPVKIPLSVKLLYGTAYKAPSAVQLFTQRLAVGDIVGNPNLQAQLAHTIELAGAFRLPKEIGEIAVNVFVTDVVGRVEFIRTGLAQQALNIQDEWVVGGELESRFTIIKPLRLRFNAGVARTVAKSGGAPPGTPEVTNPLFPAYQLHLLLDYHLPWWGLRLSAEVSYIGPRTASQSNAVELGHTYELPGYAYTAFVVSTAGRRIIPRRETNLALRVSNLINYHWVEPGFGGIDVPAQGITAFLTITQEL